MMLPFLTARRPKNSEHLNTQCKIGRAAGEGYCWWVGLWMVCRRVKRERRDVCYRWCRSREAECSYRHTSWYTAWGQEPFCATSFIRAVMQWALRKREGRGVER